MAVVWIFDVLWIGNWGLLTWTVILLSIILYLLRNLLRTARLVNALPGPDCLPLLGNLLDFFNMDHSEILQLFFYKWPIKFGDIFRVHVGPRPVIAIFSPELIEPILMSPRHITKGSAYFFLKHVFGDGLSIVTGTRWKNRRRLLTPAFHFQILNRFMDVFNEKSLDCVDEFERAVETHGDDEFDVYPIMTKISLDIICATSMGRQAGKDEEKADYLENLNRCENMALDIFMRPWISFELITKLFALGREMKRRVSVVKNFTKKVIQDRREVLKQEAEKSLQNKLLNNNIERNKDDESSKDRLALLDLLIKASENEAELDDVSIRDEVNTFMVAGHDTTALAMSWFLYLIAKHPEQQQLVMNELDGVFSGDSHRPCTTQDLTDLKYLECCIKETLRLYPSVPMIMRHLTEDVEIGGYTLPTGASIALGIYRVHHNPRIYPDPEAFKPERFLPENSTDRHPYAFVPFSAGPRNCIGQRYAMMEMKVVLATLLRRFQFSRSESSKHMIVPSFEIVLKPKHGIHLNVSKRLDIL